MTKPLIMPFSVRVRMAKLRSHPSDACHSGVGERERVDIETLSQRRSSFRSAFISKASVVCMKNASGAGIKMTVTVIRARTRAWVYVPGR
jgi:hypothetical protein